MADVIAPDLNPAFIFLPSIFLPSSFRRAGNVSHAKIGSSSDEPRCCSSVTIWPIMVVGVTSSI